MRKSTEARSWTDPACRWNHESWTRWVSVRLDPDVVRELRAIATSRNTTLSAVLRDAAAQYATHAHRVKELRWRLHGESIIEEAQAWTGPSVSESGLRLVSG